MFTQEHFNGIAMADKHGRTQSIATLYRTFLEELPEQLQPSISVKNSEKIYFDIFKSGVTFETANDPNAGRSGTRKFAHLSEAAFYRYANDIDDGIQNSIPLGDDTYIIKESTANGKAGIGKPFFDLWQQAKRGESIYKPFFVAWYEVDDYTARVPDNMKLSSTEQKLLKDHPEMTKGNLVWRRLKLLEYQGDENSLLSPEERFKQDFPTNDIEAFLSTGMPVFDLEKLEVLTNRLVKSKLQNLITVIQYRSSTYDMFKHNFTVFTPSRSSSSYYIGADVSEGLVQGDASSVVVVDENYNQVASWHGKIDPDLFGHLLIDIAKIFNNALICPEINNMGLTTLSAIRNAGYTKIYRETVEDKITREKTTKLGWRTTSKSKEIMLNYTLKLFRDDELNIRDKNLAIEMGLITRKENGNVVLNSRDRVVALCLACMARKSDVAINLTPKRSIETFDRGSFLKKKTSKDIFS